MTQPDTRIAGSGPGGRIASTRRFVSDLGRGLLVRRALQAVPVLVLATFVVFGLLKLVPGDIAIALAGDNPSDARLAEIRHQYGLDRPFFVQYMGWIFNALHGDLSRSLGSGEPVLSAIRQALPHTALIVVLALLVTLVVGLPAGVLAATRPGGWVDRVVMTSASLGVAIPNFWLAMILVELFALQFNWLPATGASNLSSAPAEALSHAALPALALAAGGIAELTRQLRSSLVDLLSSQQVRTLRAKGLSTTAILWRHGLRNVGVNLITVTGLIANRMLAATVVIEAVFAIPGTGSLIVNAVLQRDYPVVQGVVFVMVLIVIVINLAVDYCSGLIDPRIRT